jgi:tRNA (cytidine32/uridine32-2'-O)-methyltransferase
MLLQQIRIILVETSHPGNIGATARAMKTMGLKNLYLVNPCNHLNPNAIALAKGANDILEGAVLCNSLVEALSGVNIIFGTSDKSRGLPVTGVSAEECAKLIIDKYAKSNIAIIFGRERIGLTNHELLYCNYHLHIATDRNFSSLNLSQAVQIVAYELRKNLLKPQVLMKDNKDDLASVEEILLLQQHWVKVLEKVKFLKKSNAHRIQERMLRLLNRLQPDVREIRILRGMLTKIEYMLEKNSRTSISATK